MSVTLFVEGGGSGKALKTELRRGFSSLLMKSGFEGRMPRVVACGSRNDTFDRFKIQFEGTGSAYPMLLVDSESVVAQENRADRSSGAWRHLRTQDGWIRPHGASDDQAQLMVACMETWLLADREALQNHFPKMTERALPRGEGLEARSKQDVMSSLRNATKRSNRGRYDKSRDSFTLLGSVSPDELGRFLPHFRRFIDALEARLTT